MFVQISPMGAMEVIEELLKVTRDIAESTGRIAMLKSSIASLRQNGEATGEAEALLDQFEKAQEMQKAQRSRLASDLERFTR